MDFSINTYVQPVATHVRHPERLLVKTQDGDWALWFGNGTPLLSVDPELGLWILERSETIVLNQPSYWFDTSSLPVAHEVYDNEGSVAD